MSDGLKLISAILAAGATAMVVSVNPELFIEAERPVYDFVRQYQRSYRDLPHATTVQQELGIRLPAAPEPIDFYLDAVTERSIYNQLRERFGELRESMTARDMTAAGTTISQMARITRTSSRQGHQVMQMDEAMGLVVDRIENTRGSGGITGIESGWAELDAQTGGYQNSDLISIVARMGIGKTYLLLKQAQAAHRAGHNVLFVTTEMGAEPLARRYASIELGINPTLLKMNMISSWNERRIRGLFTSMAGAERFRLFSVGMNSKISAIEALCQEFCPDIVFIDGIYLLRPSAGDTKMKRIERIAEVFDETKALNLEMERPFVVSTQLNRQAGKGGKEGSLETISYTDSVGTHSSVVIAAKTGPTDNPWMSRWLEFLKGREGEHGKIAINFKFAPVDFEVFTPEQAAQEQTTRPDLNWMDA